MAQDIYSRIAQPLQVQGGSTSYFSAPEDRLDPLLFSGTNLKQNIRNSILKILGEETVINNYRKSKQGNGFIKSTGLHIDSSAELVRRADFNNVNEDCLLRNTVGNEQFLVSKIDNKLPFWFIDSGYTNFIESNKKWHRLVRNHLHYGT